MRYHAFSEVAADGVWTLHAPPEYVGASCEPSCDLRVWIDGQQRNLGHRLGSGLSQHTLMWTRAAEAGHAS